MTMKMDVSDRMAKAAFDKLLEHLPKVLEIDDKGVWSGFIRPQGYDMTIIMVQAALKVAPDWPPMKTPDPLPPLVIPPPEDRLAGIAALVRALTYGEMMDMVTQWYGRDKSDPPAPIGYIDMPMTLHAWATQPESTNG
jgi:hypothetical protein